MLFILWGRKEEELAGGREMRAVSLSELISAQFTHRLEQG
jgi:hypothetical protein